MRRDLPRNEGLRSVFLSSTFRDLSEHRSAVHTALRRAGYHSVGMEDFGADPRETLPYLQERILGCDVFVAVLGHLYGSSIPDLRTSLTEFEIDTATRAGKPILVFIATEDFPVPANLREPDAQWARQGLLRQRASTNRIRDTFRSPDELAARVLAALANLERFSASEERLPPSLATFPLPPQPFFPHPYPLSRHFKGRRSERELLTDWFTRDRRTAFALVGMGGMGKSALAWVWVQQDVLGFPIRGLEAQRSPGIPEPFRPEGTLWWSFYEREASFEGFLDHAITYAGGAGVRPADLRYTRQKIEALLGLMREKSLLFVCDGFERLLRGYSDPHGLAQSTFSGREPDLEKVDFLSFSNPLTGEFFEQAVGPGMATRLLLTTRHLPASLTNGWEVRSHDLAGLDFPDALALLTSFGIRGSPQGIKAACEFTGYHPLSLRLLAGFIAKDKHRPYDVSVADDYQRQVVGGIKGREKHVLSIAYEGLPPKQRTLLSQISAFRGPVPLEAVLSLTPPARRRTVEASLNDLLERGFLQWDEERALYDLHPLVRAFAYERLSSRLRRATHRKILSYYQSVLSIPAPQPGIDDLAVNIERYYHAARCGNYEAAYRWLHDELFYRLHYELGQYVLNISLLRLLFPHGEERPPAVPRELRPATVRPCHAGSALPPREASESAQTWTLSALGISYRVVGFHSRAEALQRKAVQLAEQLGERGGLLAGLVNLADTQWTLGRFREVEENLNKLLRLSQDFPEYEAIGHQDLGLRLAFQGRWAEARSHLESAFEAARGDRQRLTIVWLHRARYHILHARTATDRQTAREDGASAVEAAGNASSLFDSSRLSRNQVRVFWFRGAGFRIVEEFDRSEEDLVRALTGCRQIELAELEADILVELARLKRDVGDRDGSLRVAREAVEAAERHDLVLSAADAYLLLAEAALAAGQTRNARDALIQARRRARCDGPPDHSFRVAFDEAERLLKNIGP